jgi:hypothetical protein
VSYLSEVLADSPLAYYRLGDASGTTAVAEVGSNMNYTNTPTLGVAGALSASGDTDTAVTFTRTSSERVDGISSLTVGDVFTVEAWIKRASTGVAMGIVFNGGNSFEMQITSANRVKLDRAATAPIVETTTTITDTTTWHHVVITKNGATVKQYIDGADVTGTVSNSTMGSSAEAFTIAHGNNGYFDGSVDEVAVYTTALSAARVLVHYQAGSSAGQTLLASADSVDGNWTDDTGGTNLSGAIDETTASDTDYIQSELSPSASGCRVKLAAGGDPASSTGHEINWRAGKNVTGGQTINLTVKLYQGGGNSLGGGTLIADFDRNAVDALTDYVETLSGGEADAITDYADLYLEFHANAT